MGEFKKLDLIQKEKEYLNREKVLRTYDGKALRTYDGKAEDHPFFEDISDDDISEFEDMDLDEEERFSD